MGPSRDALHLPRAQALGVEHYGDGVTEEGLLGKDVDLLETARVHKLGWLTLLLKLLKETFFF